MPTIDFSQVEDLKPIPDGWYLASIVEAKPGISKMQNPKIDLRWKVEEGQYENRNVFDVLTFTKKAEFRVKATLSALDFPDDFAGEVEAEDLVGKSAYIMVVTETSTQIDEDTGEPYPPRNKIKRTRSVSASIPGGGSSNLAKLIS